MDRVERAVDDIRRKWVPDGRLDVFEISLLPKMVAGVTSSRDARDALRHLAGDAQLLENVRLIPEETALDVAGIVTAALAPLLGSPQVSAPRVSEALHGEHVRILERQDEWLRVRAPDGYVAWVHSGYVATGPADWAEDWEERAKARSVGADIQTPAGRQRLPTGARVVLRRRDATVELAGGQRGKVLGGAVRLASELRVEVYAAREIRLPRDSDQQYGQGREIKMSPNGKGYEGGDLLFFTDKGRVSHVALWAGAGHIVHSALSRGGVGTDNLFGDEPRMKRLKDSLVGVRRLAG